MKHSKLIVKHNINPNISHIALTSFTFCHNNSRLRGITVTFRLWKFAVGFHPAEKIRLKKCEFSHEIGFRTGWRTKYVFRSIYVWPLISSSLMHIQFIKNNIVRILAGMHLISNTNNKIWEEVNTENSEQKTKYNIGQSLLKRWLGASRQITKAICFNQN